MVKRKQIPSWIELETTFPNCTEVTEFLIFPFNTKNSSFLQLLGIWCLLYADSVSIIHSVLSLRYCTIFLSFFSKIKIYLRFYYLGTIMVTYPAVFYYLTQNICLYTLNHKVTLPVILLHLKWDLNNFLSYSYV